MPDSLAVGPFFAHLVWIVAVRQDFPDLEDAVVVVGPPACDQHEGVAVAEDGAAADQPRMIGDEFLDEVGDLREGLFAGTHHLREDLRTPGFAVAEAGRLLDHYCPSWHRAASLRLPA